MTNVIGADDGGLGDNTRTDRIYDDLLRKKVTWLV